MIRNILSIVLLCAAIAQGATFPQDYQAALKLYDSGKFAESKTAFEGLIAMNPNPQAVDRCLVHSAYCETQLKAHDKAAALVAKIKEEHLRTFCRMKLLTMQSKYAEVVALVKDEDFSLWPDALSFEALMIRGEASGRVRDAVAAEKDFRAALGYTINDYKKATAHLRLGGLFKGQQALECFDEVMKLKEPGATMRYQAIANRARVLAQDGKGALAIAEFDRVNDLSKQPHWTMVQMARAATHEALGETDKARACYEAVVASSNPPADSLATAKAKLSAKR
ncbi:MAG: hypothetical protein ACKVY0_04110 [Prosthecobacter sp.]|uniref:hypothetical protein n=1 Tax=Prosthecobacter sp. TaxID=1965333 RepID=UPI003900F81B